jgi:magnesium-transporting ATPase (P-type)
VAELAPFVLWALSGGSFPLVLSVLQILALDIGTDLLPAVALGGERPEPDVMRRPPRRRGTPVLDRSVLGRAFGFLGPIEAVLSLALVPIGAAAFLGWGLGDSLPDDGSDLALLSTLVFAAIVAMQMANALACRSTHASIRTLGLRTNRLLLAAVGVELLALLAAIYVPVVNDVLNQVPLEPAQWLLVLPLPFALLALEEGRKAVVRGRRAAIVGAG